MQDATYPTVEIPLEAWRQIIRRVRMLDSLRRQHDFVIDSLVETVNAVPADEAGETGGPQ